MATSPPADAVLVRRLRERDRTAWDELYAEYSPRLHAFAQRLAGNPHDADDLVQETFVRALPRFDQLDPETVELGPYLFTTLRNTFLKSVERGKRYEPVADVPEPRELAPIEDDPERSTLLLRQQAEVRVANGRLAPRQRLVLALRELEDKSYAEIGVVVGLNENAVAQLISRARESLRTELRLAQIDPSRLPEECQGFLPFLSRHLDGQLHGAQLERTLGHLESCERCQDALDSMREAQRRYRALLPLPFMEEDAKASIDTELTAAGYWSGPGRRVAVFRRGAVVIATVAVLLAVGGGGIGAAVLIGRDDPAPVAAPSSVVETTTDSAGQPTTTSGATAPPPPAPSTTAPPPPPTSPVSGPEPTTGPAEVVSPTTAKPPPPPPPPPPPDPPPPGPQPPPPPVAAVDRTAPTVTITARPPAETTSVAAVLSFRASERATTFSCRLDGGAFVPCTSPASFEGLALGEHAFAVRARDRAGNTGAATIASWRIVEPPDTTPPTTTLSASIDGSSASFSFTSSEAGSTFSCALDGSSFETCSSPRAYSRLAPGSHTFAVRATDAAGNTGAAATHTWSIAQPLPDLVITSLGRSSFTVTNVGTAPAGPFVVSVTFIGTFTFSGLAPGQSATRTWSTLCPRGRVLTAIADRGQAVAESNEGNNARSFTC